MLKTKKNLKVLMVSILLVVMTLMAVLFCSGAKAEEQSAINNNAVERAVVQENLSIHIKGDFLDGERFYGGYQTSLYIEKITDKEYKIKTAITLSTIDYKTDEYFYQVFGYYFTGKNVRVKSTLNERKDKFSARTSLGSLDKSKIDFSQKGIAGCYIDFKEQGMHKVNVYPVIEEEFRIEITGENPTIGIIFDNMDLYGVFLAKDTLVRNQWFVDLETSIIKNFANAKPSYKYVSTYKGKNLVKRAGYTTLSGPVPTTWPKPVAYSVG